MKLHFVQDMDQVLQIALEGKLPELKEEKPEALAKVLPTNIDLPPQPVSRQ
jgi:ATP-dependent Lon protease